jgi:hypothetical protein
LGPAGLSSLRRDDVEKILAERVQPCDEFFCSRTFCGRKNKNPNFKMITTAEPECGYVRALALAARECESREA